MRRGYVQYLSRGVFATLAFAFADPFLFIGYLISIALFGLYQAIFMANAGGAWDNAKKIVETETQTKKARSCTMRPWSANTVGIRSRTRLRWR